MQQANNVVLSGYAARLLRMVVCTGIRREESRVDLGGIWSSVLHLHPGFLSLRGDAHQTGAPSALGGSSPLVVPISELSVFPKQTFSAAGVEVDTQVPSWVAPGGAALTLLPADKKGWTGHF